MDGHFCSYYGEQPTPRGWDAKRRLATKGHTDVYIHDARGRSLFFFSQPLNDSLARAIPGAVKEIRRVHGKEPFTLIFDRGGYSGDTFRFLQSEGIGFITYLKGRSARRRYAAKRFKRGWFSFEDRRHSYKLFEKKTRLRGVGLIRTILFLGEDEQQIPVLTNLTPTAKAAKVVHCLRLRWRQENSFKFLSENYATLACVPHRPDHTIWSRSGNRRPSDSQSKAQGAEGGGARSLSTDSGAPVTTRPRAGRQRREKTPYHSRSENRSRPPAARDRPQTPSSGSSRKPPAPHAR